VVTAEVDPQGSITVLGHQGLSPVTGLRSTGNEVSATCLPD
jgi:hypothetical protein